MPWRNSVLVYMFDFFKILKKRCSTCVSMMVWKEPQAVWLKYTLSTFLGNSRSFFIALQWKRCLELVSLILHFQKTGTHSYHHKNTISKLQIALSTLLNQLPPKPTGAHGNWNSLIVQKLHWCFKPISITSDAKRKEGSLNGRGQTNLYLGSQLMYYFIQNSFC